ncbi:MAG: enoyl-CoA hydratase/isomerase family protein [Pseudomonadota bacterium]
MLTFKRLSVVVITFVLMLATTAQGGAQSNNPPEAFETLSLTRGGAIVRVDFDNGPLNLVDGPMLADLARLAAVLAADTDAKVVVFGSANPEFFLARADLALLARLEAITEPPAGLSPFHQLTEAYRALPQITIAEVCGITRGAGSEFVLALDIRIACDDAVFSQPEIGFALQPGGGAFHRLSENVGRSRALEIIVSGRDLSGAEAAAYGWVNRSMPHAELADATRVLAGQIARWDHAALTRAKRTYNAVAGFDDTEERHARLQIEFARFVEAVQSDAGRARINAFASNPSDPVERERRLQHVLSDG